MKLVLIDTVKPNNIFTISAGDKNVNIELSNDIGLSISKRLTVKISRSYSSKY